MTSWVSYCWSHRRLDSNRSNIPNIYNYIYIYYTLYTIYIYIYIICFDTFCPGLVHPWPLQGPTTSVWVARLFLQSPTCLDWDLHQQQTALCATQWNGKKNHWNDRNCTAVKEIIPRFQDVQKNSAILRLLNHHYINIITILLELGCCSANWTINIITIQPEWCVGKIRLPENRVPLVYHHFALRIAWNSHLVVYPICRHPRMP